MSKSLSDLRWVEESKRASELRVNRVSGGLLSGSALPVKQNHK